MRSNYELKRQFLANITHEPVTHNIGWRLIGILVGAAVVLAAFVGAWKFRW